MPAHVPPLMEYLAPFCAMITIAISLPLIFRKVPPNYFYGVRTRKTLSDRRIWYEANYRGGLALSISSAAFLVLWLFLVALLGRASAAIIGMFCWLGLTILATAVCLVQVRQL